MADNTTSIQEIPTRFPTIPLKFGVERKVKKIEDVPTHLPQISLDKVEPWTGEIIMNDEEDTQASSGLVEFRENDVLFCKLRPYLAKGFVAKDNGAASPEFLVFDPKEFIPEYILYLMLSKEFINRVDESAYGARMPRASWDFIGNIKVPNPDKEMQEKIVEFLDYEVSRIDSLIDRKKLLLDLLEEREGALMHKSVTGWDTNIEIEECNEIPWLNKIPKRWRTAKLKHVTDKPVTYGIVQAGPHIEDGVPYIRVSDMKGDQLPKEGYKKTSKEIHDKYSRSVVTPGDLVLAIRATVGKVLPVPDYLPEANLTQGTARISPGRNVTREYLFYILNSPLARQHFHSLSKGATFDEVTLNMVRNFRIPLPPVKDQKEITQLVESTHRNLDNLTERTEEGIDLLREKRKVLITKAVTGQIDLNDWQPPDKREATP